MTAETAPSHDSVLPPLPSPEHGDASFSSKQSPAKPKNMHWIIILIVCYVILLYGGAAYFFFFKKPAGEATEPNTTERALPNIQKTETTKEAASDSFESLNERTPLPLIRLTGTEQQTRATASGTIDIPLVLPSVLNGQCAAYQFGSFFVVGPKNWNAYVTETSGEVNIRLYRSQQYTYGDTAIWYGRTTTGSNDSILAAASFFPWMQTNETIAKLSLSLPDVRTDYTIQEVTPRLLRYSLVLPNPAFDNLGIVYTDIADHLKDTKWTTYYMTTNIQKNTLSAEFITELLNTFIQQYQLQ